MTNSPMIESPSSAGQPPPGPPHRPSRRRRIAWAAGLTAFVLALSLTIYFVQRTDSGQPTASNPTASQSATASAPAVTLPSTSARASTSTTPSPTAAAAPDGRIPAQVLKNAMLPIPPWPHAGLPAGWLRFTDGAFNDPGGNGTRNIIIRQIVYGDVDRDGAAETVAAIRFFLAGADEQLVAFDRDAAGRIVALGTVVSTTDPIRQFDTDTFQIASSGVITVRVADYAGCCGDETKPQWQWRSYGWDGHGFRQVGGPTAFPVNPQVTETAVSAGDLVLGPATNGTRHGTLAVTVSYLYGAVPDYLTIVFSLSPDLHPEGTWPPVNTWHSGLAVHEPSPAAGASATYTFGFSETPISGTTPEVSVSVSGIGKNGDALNDADPFNDMATANVRTVG